MTGILILTKDRIFWKGPFTLMFLAIACSQNLSLPSPKDSAASPTKYLLSERQLTPAELNEVLSQLDQNIEKTSNSQVMGSLYQDRRTPQQRQEINAYINSWASIDPEIAPFLGRRQIIEDTFIYPSLKKGQVCILQQYTSSDESEKGVLFSLGNIENGILQTSSNQTIIARNELLAVISTWDNKSQFSLLPHPLPLKNPELNQRPDIQKHYDESQCQFAPPL